MNHITDLLYYYIWKKNAERRILFQNLLNQQNNWAKYFNWFSHLGYLLTYLI